MEDIKRRNLSGIYIFHKFEDEEKQQPTCFEDCPIDKQIEWLNSLSEEGAKNLALQLAETLRDIGNVINLKRD